MVRYIDLAINKKLITFTLLKENYLCQNIEPLYF